MRGAMLDVLMAAVGSAASIASARAETRGPAGGDGGTATVSGCGTMAETNSTGSSATPIHYVVVVAMRGRAGACVDGLAMGRADKAET